MANSDYNQYRSDYYSPSQYRSQQSKNREFSPERRDFHSDDNRFRSGNGNVNPYEPRDYSRCSDTIFSSQSYPELPNARNQYNYSNYENSQERYYDRFQYNRQGYDMRREENQDFGGNRFGNDGRSFERRTEYNYRQHAQALPDEINFRSNRAYPDYRDQSERFLQFNEEYRNPYQHSNPRNAPIDRRRESDFQPIDQETFFPDFSNEIAQLEEVSEQAVVSQSNDNNPLFQKIKETDQTFSQIFQSSSKIGNLYLNSKATIRFNQNLLKAESSDEKLNLNKFSDADDFLDGDPLSQLKMMFNPS